MNDQRIFLGTVAGWGFILSRVFKVPAWIAYSGPALVLHAATQPDAPPSVRSFGSFLTSPTRALLASGDASCCESCASGGECSSGKTKPGADGPVYYPDDDAIEATFSEVPS